MTKVGSIFRLLMIVSCLVPFTSPRQAAAFALTPVGSEGQREEDETEREEEEATSERAHEPHQRFDRLPTALARIAYPLRATPGLTPPPTFAAPIDPFRNGLGCPYRC